MSEYWVDIQKDPKHVARERQKARELRNTNWWRSLLSRGICHYCKQKFSPDELTMDHIVPVARGGKSTRGNIVPACRNCNAGKNCLTPVEQIFAELEAQEKAAEKPQIPLNHEEES